MKAHIVAIVLAILGPASTYLSLATHPEPVLFFIGAVFPIVALGIAIFSPAEKKSIKVAAILISCIAMVTFLYLFGIAITHGG